MTMKARGANAKLDSAAIYDQLRSDILSCRLPPGAPIYEQDLGRRFGVSKSPVREALVRAASGRERSKTTNASRTSVKIGLVGSVLCNRTPARCL